MSSNTNDAIPAAFLAWGLALFTMPRLRGFMLGLATAAKFSPVLLVPLWLRADRRPRQEPLEWEYTEGGPPLVPRPGAARARLGPAAARADRAQGRCSASCSRSSSRSCR